MSGNLDAARRGNRRLAQALCLALLLAAGKTAAAPPGGNALPEPVDLSGQWELLGGHGDLDVAADPGKFTGWQATTVPGLWPDGRLPCAWQVKRFSAPAEAKGLNCELLIERVHWNATVWLNGRKLGSWPDGYAPFRLLAADALKPGEENVLVVRVGGFGEVPKGKNGKPLFPAGFATAGRGGGGGIMGRVFVRFFHKVRLTRLQVTADLDASAARVLVRLEGSVPEATVQLAVLEGDTGREVGRAQAPVKLTGGAGDAVLPVSIKGVKTWEPRRPFLYRLRARVLVDGRLADQSEDRFGMRQVTTRPDGIYLNGRKVRLMGANLIGDYGFWRGAPNLMEREKIKSVLVDPARRLNAICVRTHTAPIPKWWLDVCDEEGLLVLLEFPVTVNTGKIDFDDAELAAWKRNMEAEATALVPYLANHPSIVMWVMTNESNNWHEYERTKLYEHFRKLDASVPVIRASYDTPDAIDVHSYAAMWKGSCGDFELRCRTQAAKARQAKLPVMITEYLGGMDQRVTRKWFGPDADTADPQVRQRVAVRSAEFHASRAMEQTEAARRLDYACIMPFGPGFWTGREDAPPSPTFLAIRSAIAPVGVSIDLSNQHFVAGQAQETGFFVINDTDEKVKAKVIFRLTATDPGFDPEAAGPKALSESSADGQVDAQSKLVSRFVWTVPAEEGQYFLLARLERAGAKPVTSRRVVYSIRRQPPPKELAGKKLLIVEEGDRKLSAWASRLGCNPTTTAPADADLVVIAPRAASGEAFKALAAELPGYVLRGGRVLVLEQFDWPRLKDLLNIQIERSDYDDDSDEVAGGPSGGSSRVFRWEQPERAIWKSIPEEYLWRWNGQTHRVARVSMSTLPGRARILVRYAEAERDDLKYVPVAAVPHGQGEVLYFMLQVAGRYDPADPDYDPVVERLMVNLLGY